MANWKYEEYCEWGRRMALLTSKNQIEEDLAAVEFDLGVATGAHLRAVGESSSMQSNSQTRAQARNNVEGLSEKRRALRDALEIYESYPDKCLSKSNPTDRWRAR